MKYLALLALPLSLCLAQENQPEPVETPAATVQEDNPTALAKEAEPYLASSKLHVELLQKLRDVLKSVADTETANAAAGAVDTLSQQVKAAMEQEQALPEPCQEVQYLVSAEMASVDLETLTNESIGKAIELQEMDTPCFGSGAMEQALSALLSLYLQDDEEEVEAETEEE